MVNGSGTTVEVEYSLFVPRSAVTDDQLQPKQIDSTYFGDDNQNWQLLPAGDFSWQVEKTPSEPLMPPGIGMDYSAYPNKTVHIKLKLQSSKALRLFANTQPRIGSDILLFKLRISKIPDEKSEINNSSVSVKETLENNLQQSEPIINCRDMYCNTMFGEYRKSQVSLGTEAYVIFLPAGYAPPPFNTDVNKTENSR